MEKRNFFIKAAYCLTALSIVVLIGLCIFQHQQIKKLSRIVSQETLLNNESSVEGPSSQIETRHTDVAKSTNPTAKENNLKSAAGNKQLTGEEESNTDEIDELEYQLDAAEEELDMAHEQLADEAAKKAELKKKELELQKKYLESPSYKNTMKDFFDSQYGDLLKDLNLSPEKLDEFKELLVDGQTQSTDFYMEMQNATPSEEKRAEFEQRQKALNEDQETKFKEFLGNSDYEKYQEYQRTSGFRYNVNGFMETLGSGEKLTETQQQELIEAMKEETENISSEMSDEDKKFLFPSERYEEERIERYLERQERIHEAYIDAAKNILSSSQTDKYREYLKQRHDMIESSLKLQALRYSD